MDEQKFVKFVNNIRRIQHIEKYDYLKFKQKELTNLLFFLKFSNELLVDLVESKNPNKYTEIFEQIQNNDDFLLNQDMQIVSNQIITISNKNQELIEEINNYKIDNFELFIKLSQNNFDILNNEMLETIMDINNNKTINGK